MGSLLLVLLLGPVWAWSQTPMEGEFQVNEATGGFQRQSDVAKAPDGSFVVVWSDYGSSPGLRGVTPHQIDARRFGSDGTPLTGALQIDQGTTVELDYDPRIDSDVGGNFVVVWTKRRDFRRGGNTSVIYHRLVDSTGSPVGSQFQVSTSIDYYRDWNAGVSKDARGNFVVVWQGFYYSLYGGGRWKIFRRRFSSDGAPLENQFLVRHQSQGPFGNLRDPAVSHNSSSGEFVVVWARYTFYYSWAISGRRYDSMGSPIGAEFQVNTSTPLHFSSPDISHDSEGNFVVAWDDYYPCGAGPPRNIFARRFNSAGNPLGDQFQVNQYTVGSRRSPRISHDPSGGFVVAWQSDPQDGSGYGVFARLFDSSGSAQGAEFQVNQYTTSFQGLPALSHDSSGGFVLSWESYGQDGSDYGVFARGTSAPIVTSGPAAGGASLVRRHQRG